MKVYQHIKQARYWIGVMKQKMHSIKDRTNLAKHVELINTVISLVNDVEYMIEVKHSGDVIDKLILARIYSQIFPLYATDSKIDIHKIIRNIDNDIRYPKEVIKKNITDFLIGKEIDLEIRKQHPNLKTITTPTEYNDMLDDLVQQVKQHISWN